MKILMVSMNSIHFKRWTNQLKDSGYEVYWFNINDGGYSNELSWVKQILGWKHRFKDIKGRVFFKKQFPKVYNKLKFLIENNVEKAFEKVLVDIKPDLVHSFALYISCEPILNVMNKHKNLKWIYSSWGSDLYYFQNESLYLNNIKKVLSRVNYLFTDCNRDTKLAKKYGFIGEELGVYPGGGGFSLKEYQSYIEPVKDRDIILVKGYQGRSGRAIPVLKALETLSAQFKKYTIVVFGADKDVVQFIDDNSFKEKFNIKVYSKTYFLPHIEIIKLMGKSLIYMGNSNSDGMPNTLLEAIIMGAFPIQSNPGGASAEIIVHGENGFLIEDCNNSEEIKEHLNLVINNSDLIKRSFKINHTKAGKELDKSIIKTKVIQAYNKAFNS